MDGHAAMVQPSQDGLVTGTRRRDEVVKRPDHASCGERPRGDL